MTLAAACHAVRAVTPFRGTGSLSMVVVNGTAYAGPDDGDRYAFSPAAGTRAPRRPGPALPHPDLSLRARR